MSDLKLTIKYFMIFYLSGSVGPTYKEIEIDSPGAAKNVEWPEAAYAYKIERQEFVKREHDGKVFAGEREPTDGKLHYHPDSKIEDYEAVKRNPMATNTLHINIFGGLIYEGQLLKSNLKSLNNDMTALVEGDKDYKPECSQFYNPFRWWKSKEEQRKTYRNSPLLCD